jgi:hypothetical protein
VRLLNQIEINLCHLRKKITISLQNQTTECQKMQKNRAKSPKMFVTAAAVTSACMTAFRGSNTSNYADVAHDAVCSNRVHCDWSAKTAGHARQRDVISSLWHQRHQ